MKIEELEKQWGVKIGPLFKSYGGLYHREVIPSAFPGLHMYIEVDKNGNLINFPDHVLYTSLVLEQKEINNG